MSAVPRASRRRWSACWLLIALLLAGPDVALADVPDNQLELDQQDDFDWERLELRSRQARERKLEPPPRRGKSTLIGPPPRTSRERQEATLDARERRRATGSRHARERMRQQARHAEQRSETTFERARQGGASGAIGSPTSRTRQANRRFRLEQQREAQRFRSRQ